jgi:subtilisin family serine protease
MKKILILILLLTNLIFADSFLIIPKQNIGNIGESFIQKQKYIKNKLLDANQQDYLNKFSNIILVTEEELKDLDPNSYVIYDNIIKYKIEQTSVNDPQFSEQWSMRNTNAIKAWEYATGNGVIVAVIDTGIDYDHEDLKNSLWINFDEDLNQNGIFEPWSKDTIINDLTGDFDGVDNDGNGFIDDVIGFDMIDQDLVNFGDYQNPDPNPRDEQNHGTTVSGIIAATHNNNIGITGAAYNSKIMTLRAFDAAGEGESDDIARCIIYAALNGAKVINMSFGESIKSPIVADAISFAYSMGCVMVASSGNSNNPRAHYPSDLPQVISVAGTNEQNSRYGFSNYGGMIDIAAPGNDVLTTSMDNEYKRSNGTSFAAPFIASAAALLFEINPDLTPSQLRSILQNSSFDLGDNGWDVFYGAGLVNLRDACLEAIETDINLDFSLFDNSFNNDVIDSIAINGTIALPLMQDFQVFIGQGDYPDNLSLFDRNTFIDSLDRQDSLEAISSGETFFPIDRRTYEISESDAFNFKWDTVFTSSRRFLNEEIFNLNIKDLNDTTYSLRLIVNLINGKQMEYRTRFDIFNNNTELQFSNLKRHEILHNGKNRQMITAITNKDAKSFFAINRLTEKENQDKYDSRAHTFVIDQEMNFDDDVILGFNRNNQTSSFGITDFDYNHFAVPKETFKRTGEIYPLTYLFNGVSDLDNDGNIDVLLNDMSNLVIGNSLHYEFENDRLELKQEFNEAWLPVGYGDTDGDGNKEVLTSAGIEYRLFENQGSNPFSEVLFQNGIDLAWAEGLYDFDGDGKEEIIINNEINYIIYTNKNGTYEVLDTARLPLEYQQLNIQRFGIAGDFNKDGTSQLCISNRFGHLMIYDFINGKLELSQYFDEPVSFSRQFLQALDLDGDGIDEIVSLNYGSSSIFGNIESINRFWLVRVFKSFNGSYRLETQKYISGVQDGFVGTTGISFRNGIASGELDNKAGAELVISTFPNVYVFNWDDGDLNPIWFQEGVISNSALIYDFNKNGKNELGINTFRGLEFFEFDDSIELNSPTNFEGYALNESQAFLSWDAVANADKYEIWKFTGNGNQIELFTETGADSITVDNLENNTLHRFVIRACNNVSCSDYGSEILDIFTHKPIELIEASQINNKSFLLKFDGKLPLKETNNIGLLFNHENDFIVEAESIFISSDSTVIFTTLDDLISGSGTFTVTGYRDFYNTPIPKSEIEIQTTFIVSPDEIYISDFGIQASSLIGIEFSEDVDFGADNPDNYLIEPFGSVLSVGIVPGDSNKVQLFISSDASRSIGFEYTLKVKDVFGKSGKPITDGPGSTIQYSFTETLLNSVYIYPHPVTRQEDSFVFANLTANTRIVVFTYDGQKIIELIENDGNGGVEWDGRDMGGKFLDPGIYFWKAIDEEAGHESALKKMFVK